MASQASLIRAAAHVEACCSTGTSPGHAGHVPVALTLTDGRRHREPLGYEWLGDESESPIVALGGISADRHLTATAWDSTPGWWSGVVGSGLGLDPSERPVLGVDWLSPLASASSVVGRASITTHDQARGLHRILAALGAERVTLVGASYGGMVALAFAELFPELAEAIVVLCAAHRPHPMATAWRSIQRKIVQLGELAGAPAAGVSLARELAMTTYRSASEFEERFAWRPTSHAGVTFPVDGYLAARGRDFADRFSADDFVTLSRSIDLHAVDASAITTPLTLVSFDSDVLAPPWLVDELARVAPGASRHLSLSSPYGHDAFLKEADQVSTVLRDALRPGAVS